MYYKKVVVTAQSFLRNSGKATCEPRKETIDLIENQLFTKCETIMDIKECYESFWNHLNPRSTYIVFVQSIDVEE